MRQIYKPESMSKRLPIMPATDNRAAECRGICAVILESLALDYRYVQHQIEKSADGKLRKSTLSAVVQNQVLCQFAADATGLPFMPSGRSHCHR